MDLVEIKEKQRLRREEAAKQISAIADALARHNEVEFVRGGMTIKMHVPDEVELKIEFEVGEDERELEIDLTW